MVNETILIFDDKEEFVKALKELQKQYLEKESD